MIFVTVGMHEQRFDRLIREIDRLKREGIITDKVFIQTGYSKYKPQFCEFIEFIKFNEMMEMIEKARVIVTHGGPGSIMPAIYNGKVPIVIPRKKEYGEVVDNHQINFCKKLEERGKIIVVYKIDEMENKIKNYDELVKKLKKIKEEKVSLHKDIQRFSKAIDEICKNLLQKKAK